MMCWQVVDISVTLGRRNVGYHDGNVGQRVGSCAGLVLANCGPRVGHVLTNMYPGLDRYSLLVDSRPTLY